MKLTIDLLKKEATEFCKHESNITHEELFGVTDGKAIGTYIEHKFEEHLKNKYDIIIGSSAKGIDLPEKHINTDIKVTSDKKPQNSSPFKNIEQKIYGLGHNLLIFVYEKVDMNNNCYLDFKHCIFIEDERSGDYHLTKMLRKMIKKGAKKGDIVNLLELLNVPGDYNSLETIAKRVLLNPPKQGYLTISNAFQWRIKYNNLFNLEKENITGIYNYKKEDETIQTPLYITDMICNYLKNNLKINPNIIIDLNCENSNFLISASNFFEKNDLNSANEHKLNKNIPDLKLISKKTFSYELNNLNNANSFLIYGNILEKMNKKNENAKQIVKKIINRFYETKSTIVLLSKTTKARNIFIELIKNKIPYSFIKQLNFNSSDSQNIADECILIIQFGEKQSNNKICEVLDIYNPSKKLHDYGFISKNFYQNIDDTPPIDGKCQFEWKHGIKHDCTKVMELTCKNKRLTNKNNELIKIESTLLYPILKSSHLKKPIVNETSQYIIVTQEKIRQDTNYIKTLAPKTWKYLNEHKKYFENRKSSIYNNVPDFSIYGIGEYSFKKYKVAIAGFSKTPIFSLVYSEKSMMLDDACYFLPFDDYESAYTTMLILNSKLVKKFLKNIAFLDSKRPYSKKVLKRIDIKKCLNFLTLNDLKETENELELEEYITQDKLSNYIKLLN